MAGWTARSTTKAAHIVGVRFLNSRPLVAGLEHGVPAPFPFTYTAAEPAQCAAALAEGTALAALVPVVALWENPRVRVVEGLGVACRGAVQSVLLLSKLPLEGIRLLAVHAASRTSEVLARLFLAWKTGKVPDITRRSPPLEDMLKGADAAVVIGDPALHLRGRSGYLEVDLGEAWREWTGLPFVFAQWAVAQDAPAGTAQVLERSLAWAEQHWEELLPRWSVQHNLALAQVREYLGERIHFRLDTEDQRGREKFLHLAVARGLLPAVSPFPAMPAKAVESYP